MRLGIYIGSFNPPHLGHKKVIDFLLEEDYVDKIIIVPTQNYWNKNNLIDIKDRINMLKFYENKNVIVDTVNNNYKYTYELLNKLQKDYKDDYIYLIIGSDNLKELHKWKNVEEILKYKVIVLNRGKFIINKKLKNYKDKFIFIKNYNYINISSTDIRNGNMIYLNTQVKRYIENNKLYKTIEKNKKI